MNDHHQDSDDQQPSDHSRASGPERVGEHRKLVIAMAVAVVATVAEGVGGWLSNSLALLSDAAHMMADAAAIGLSLFALRMAARPADSKRTYGYYRLEILAALLNGAFLFAIAAGIAIEGYHRLMHPEPVHVRARGGARKPAAFAGRAREPAIERHAGFCDHERQGVNSIA